MNKEELRAYMKAYRQLHSEELKAKKKAYYQLHSEELKAKQKAYRQLPEVKAKQKAYYQLPDVKARLAAYIREWNKKQTEKRNEERQHPEFYKKKAKDAEKNIKEILAKHNLSHLKSAMILDGIRLDNELKKRKIKVLA